MKVANFSIKNAWLLIYASCLSGYRMGCCKQKHMYLETKMSNINIWFWLYKEKAVHRWTYIVYTLKDAHQGNQIVILWELLYEPYFIDNWLQCKSTLVIARPIMSPPFILENNLTSTHMSIPDLKWVSSWILFWTQYNTCLAHSWIRFKITWVHIIPIWESGFHSFWKLSFNSFLGFFFK